MDDLFTLNSAVSVIDLYDGMTKRLTQIMGINDSLRLSYCEEAEVASDVISSALWAVDSLLGELKQLQSTLWEKISNSQILKQEKQL